MALADSSHISETDKAYLAGIVDGEGSISLNLQRDGNNSCYKLTVNITSTSIAWLRDLRTLWGSVGSVSLHPRANPRWRPTLSWQVRGRQAQDLLRLVYPYLGIKRDRASIALSYRPGKVGKRTSSAQKEEQRQHAESLRRLNLRGQVVPPNSLETTIH